MEAQEANGKNVMSSNSLQIQGPGSFSVIFSQWELEQTDFSRYATTASLPNLTGPLELTFKPLTVSIEVVNDNRYRVTFLLHRIVLQRKSVPKRSGRGKQSTRPSKVA